MKRFLAWTLMLLLLCSVFASIIHKVYNYETISDEFDR